MAALDPQAHIAMLERELQWANLTIEKRDAQRTIDCLRNGAKGVFPKSGSEFKLLCKCVECVHQGQIWASSEELSWLLSALESSVFSPSALRVVDVKGERVLTASCIRKPTPGMEVQTQTERAIKSRQMVFELLASNMRPRDEGPDNQSLFWEWAGSMGISGSERFGSKFEDDEVHAEFVGEYGFIDDVANHAAV